MTLRSDQRRWGGVAKTFHWLMALGIVGAGVLGLVMTGMERGMAKLNAFALHKSIGLTVLALFVLRLAWRFFDRRPADLPMPRIQRITAHAVHGVLYLFMLAIPLSGWIYNSARGYPLQWFKQFNLPALAEKSDDLAQLAIGVHVWLFWLLVVVLAAHVGGALLHHFFERDDTLRRMLPFARLRATPPGDAP
ncbi:MAG TPA: cytochrome b [Dokdonella sp.]|uniref:cytochrome b n=1 Tax=Dokdonella sp. TaxID=2291710 RepID=UPI0025C4CD7B|nr:cytochrome b [Dokdonella sp.]MBX3690902.1 cytochrome b [Dokdonella sp.]MCW5567283.1 cytochrome b [Dokdonella sp.]HNR92006.1 cytochrome b [Dokdonella sp.]